MAYATSYLKKEIIEINPSVDYKVKIVGIVVDKKQDTIMVDDGTGKVKVFIDLPVMIERVDVNQLVAIFGSTLPLENGFDIRADIIRDLSGLDINIYKKVDELYKRLGV